MNDNKDVLILSPRRAGDDAPKGEQVLDAATAAQGHRSTYLTWEARAEGVA